MVADYARSDGMDEIALGGIKVLPPPHVGISLRSVEFLIHPMGRVLKKNNRVSNWYWWQKSIPWNLCQWKQVPWDGSHSKVVSDYARSDGMDEIALGGIKVCLFFVDRMY